MHRFVCFFLGDVDVSVDAGDGFIRDQERVAVSVDVEPAFDQLTGFGSARLVLCHVPLSRMADGSFIPQGDHRGNAGCADGGNEGSYENHDQNPDWRGRECEGVGDSNAE